MAVQVSSRPVDELARTPCLVSLIMSDHFPFCHLVQAKGLGALCASRCQVVLQTTSRRSPRKTREKKETPISRALFREAASLHSFHMLSGRPAW
jgi:hypothetical protein